MSINAWCGSLFYPSCSSAFNPAPTESLHLNLCKLLNQELIPHRYSSSCCFYGDHLQNASGSVVSNQIGIKLGITVPQVNTSIDDGVGF